MITRRQAAFSVLYVLVFAGLAALGYTIGDYGLRMRVEKITAPAPDDSTATTYYDLPRINLSIADADGDRSFLYLDMSLEVQKKDLGRLEGFQPRITDRLVEYLRRQDAEELRQPGEEDNFKSELLEQTNKASYPVPVVGIVFRRLDIL